MTKQGDRMGEVGCPACLGVGREGKGVVVELCWLCVGRKVVPEELAARHAAGAAEFKATLAGERARQRWVRSAPVDEPDSAS